MPDHDAWPAFVMPWDDGTHGPTDMSHLLEKPAGAHGFIRCQDGHLVTGDGRRWRIWGVNITFGDPMPTQDEAEAITRRLAKFGVNCVRLHHIDRRWPNGLILRRMGPEPDPSRLGRDDESTRSLDPEALARLDYFVACCKAQGIYIGSESQCLSPLQRGRRCERGRMAWLWQGADILRPAVDSTAERICRAASGPCKPLHRQSLCRGTGRRPGRTGQ